MPSRLSPSIFLAAMGLFCIAADKPKYDPNALVKQDDAWFKSDEGQMILDNVVSWQNKDGGWYKEYDLAHPRPAVLPTDGKSFGGVAWTASSTIDNDATHSEMRLLARGIHLLNKPTYRVAFDRGLAYLEAMQYPNGGFPQRYPLPKNYGRMITFNDDAMCDVLKLLQDITAGKGDFAVATAEQKAKAKTVFDKGIECILNCQIKVNGKLTVWCQQHDPDTLAPTGARAFELPGLTSTESANLTLLLMSLDKPSPRVKAAVDGAVAWFDANKIQGKKWGFVTGAEYEGGKDRLLTDDPAGPPLWARFYDIENGKPFFVSRDGVKHWAVTDISHERRVGYAWYSTSPQKVLTAYEKWKKANG